MEAALATVIIGTGFLAILELFAACTMQNAQGNQMTAALMLANNIREQTAGLHIVDPGSGSMVFGPEVHETPPDYDDVDDYDGSNFSPPIDAWRNPLPDLRQYTQVITVAPVFPDKLSSNTDDETPDVPKGTYTGAVRVRVRVLYQARPTDAPEEVYRSSWILCQR